MTKESHQRGSELLPLIEEAKNNLNRWETAISFRDGARILCEFRSNSGYDYVSSRHIPFEVVKTLSIDSYRKEIEALEKEFNSL